MVTRPGFPDSARVRAGRSLPLASFLYSLCKRTRETGRKGRKKRAEGLITNDSTQFWCFDAEK